MLGGGEPHVRKTAYAKQWGTEEWVTVHSAVRGTAWQGVEHCRWKGWGRNHDSWETAEFLRFEAPLLLEAYASPHS